MNIEEYISSGIIESYALGLVSNQEKQEVECMSHIYPEIAEAVEDAVMGLEVYANAHAIEPAPKLKTSILDAAFSEEQESAEVDSEEDKKVVSLGDNFGNEESSHSSIRSLRWGIAASLILFLTSTIVLFKFYGEKIDAQTAFVEQEEKSEKLASELTSTESALAAAEHKLDQYPDNLLNIIHDPSYKMVHMEHVDGKPEQSLATVFWSNESGDAYVNVQSLPAPPSDKDYQLWAIVDGKPVDMGVLDAKTVGSDLQKIGVNIKNAQAFAVTLEVKGGSPTPTMEQMYVMGGV